MRFLPGLLFLCQIVLAQAQSDPFPSVAKSYRVEVNGSLVWEKQGDRRLAPASLTKLMTALLVVEQGQAHGIVTVSAAAARESGSRIGLKQGEMFQVNDLLAAALIASGNDACRALADHLAGSQSHFVQRMNQRAAELGMRNTHFSNACGHDAVGHFSSAQDLALLAHALLQSPLVRELVALKEARIVAQEGGRSYWFSSTNALIGRYPGALGLKTGHTAKAGNCLIALAQRGNLEVLLVLLHGQDRWWDAVDMLDLAFAHAARSV